MEATARYEPGPIDKVLWYVLGVTGIILGVLGVIDIAGIEAATPVINGIKATINWTMGPVVYFVVSCLGFAAMLYFRQCRDFSCVSTCQWIHRHRELSNLSNNREIISGPSRIPQVRCNGLRDFCKNLIGQPFWSVTMSVRSRVLGGLTPSRSPWG